VSAWTRREVLRLLAASTLPAPLPIAGSRPRPNPDACRIRTITAGVPISSAADLSPIAPALTGLAQAKKRFEGAGYELQTIRIATTPFIAPLSPTERDRLLPALRQLDSTLASAGAIASLGPVLTRDAESPELAGWIGELLQSTTRLSLSVQVGSSRSGSHTRSAAVVAKAIKAVSLVTPGGSGNFRLAATACIPAGTPFFPAAYHAAPGPTLALGLEAAGLVQEPLATNSDPTIATARLTEALAGVFRPVEALARQTSARLGWQYLGIDPSPAPGLDRSIGAALEAFVGAPFGSPGTLEACAVVTAALKRLPVQTCGYAGLMLPVLEDPRLAQRATEGRFDLGDLLLYSSVCGTGLDVVPVPGSVSEAALTRVIRDVSALAVKWNKPLSARLFPIPGGEAGDMTTFNDPLLTNCRILPLPER
jgi:uncharacterized protein